MKKLKRISAVLLLAAGFALAFGGCSNTKDETGTEQGGGAGSGDETGGTGGSENPGDSGSSGNQGSGNEGNAGGNGSSGEQTGSGNNSGNTGGTGDSGTSSGGQTGGGTEKPDDNVKVITVFDPGVTEITKWQSNAGEVVSGTDGNKYLKVTTKSWNDAMFYIEGVNLTGKTKFSFMAYVDEATSNGLSQICIDLVANESEWVNVATVAMNPVSTTPKTVEGDFSGNESETSVCSMIKPYAQNASWAAVDGVTIYIGKITAE